MTQTIYRASRDRPELVAARETRIEGGDAPSARPAAPPQGTGASCVRGTPAANGRIPRSCPDTDWLLNWSSDLSTSKNPRFLLASADRVYVGGKFNWTLHKGEDGEVLTGAQKGKGDPCFAAGGVLIQPDSEGLIQGVDLETGGEYFWISPFMGSDFRRPYVANLGETLLVQGVEIEHEHGSDHVAELSSVEAWPLGEPLDIGPTRQLRPGAVEPVLLENLQVICAAWSGGAVTAERNRILCFNLSLQATAVFTGEFMPVALSLDEAGWMHFVMDEGPAPEEGVEAPPATRALWVVDPAGVRRVRWPLPRPLQQLAAPPLVGHDHRIYLVGDGLVLALEPDGALAWSRPLHAETAGAVVTPNGHLLVSEEKELSAFDPSGQRRVLHTFAKQLVTAPVLTTSDRLLVATSKALHCLTPVPQL